MSLINALFSASWVGPVITAMIMVVAGFYIRQSAKNQADKAAKDAYQGAIDAMKAHIEALQERIKDAEEENKRLRAITETILETLKTRDIHITIEGHIIAIREGKETIITKIQ